MNNLKVAIVVETVKMWKTIYNYLLYIKLSMYIIMWKSLDYPLCIHGYNTLFDKMLKFCTFFIGLIHRLYSAFQLLLHIVFPKMWKSNSLFSTTN